MNIISFFVFSLLFLFSPSPVNATSRTALSTPSKTQTPLYKTYTNVRFFFAVDYPVEILRPQGEAPNGDGQVFLSRDGLAEVRVYGSYSNLKDNLNQHYVSVLKSPQLKVTYHHLDRNWYVVSGHVDQGKRIFYEKTYYHQKATKTLQMIYPSSQKKTYDPIVIRMSKSFRQVLPE